MLVGRLWGLLARERTRVSLHPLVPVKLNWLVVTSQGDCLEWEQAQMKKDLAEVKAYAEAMADSNCARDAYIDKEQGKFFRRVNRQQANIDVLKEWMERLELRARALELENELLSARLDSMVDKLCFCTWVEVTFLVVGSDLSIWRKTNVIPLRSIKLSLSSSTPTNLWIIRRTLRLMLSQVFLNRPPQNVQQMFRL